MTPAIDHDLVQVFLGDCLDVIAELPGERFDTIVGDPPYCSGGRQQASARQVFEKARHRVGWIPADNMGTDTYLWWQRQVAGACLDKCEPGAHAYVFTDWRMYPSLVAAWESKGWTLRSCLVWDKAKGGAMGAFWRNNHEWVAIFTKGPAREIAHRSAFNTWTGAKTKAGDHPTEKPVALLAYMLEAAGARRVLDPWCGSGSTLVACKQLGIRGVGVEIDPEYVEYSRRRLAQEVLL
jgi:site-specific DNA-methyltransferase (adenine-specific)